MKKICAVILIGSLFLLLLNTSDVNAILRAQEKDGGTIAVTNTTDTQLDISSTAAVLIEGSTGTVIYDKNKDEQLRPASITKVMTLLLIFEALDSGQIKLTDEVSVSDYAASMGGSQVYLEPYEVQTVETMIKCISISSANDASVAMAEFIAGSEEEFVAKMNKKAQDLGMKNTHFVNCCGLDTDNHYSSAYDVALMSRELITKHPEISKYSTVWMDTIIHTTKKGQTEFGLTNTNKLIKTYQGITGLKTGSTGLAKYCVTASAKKNNMDLIAVIMAAPDTKTRFMEASKLLNYGFANYSIYTDDNTDIIINPVKVVKGVADTVQGTPGSTFSYLCIKGKTPEEISKKIIPFEEIQAPVAANEKIGEIIYYYGDEEIGSVDILASQAVDKAGYKDCFVKVLKRYFLGTK
ncbi:MAG TPA: D-alanyl-D-alanine carboxypeptidase family protein [Mobilitalea sp.]|nr:D-alanyl-D-alanine carboxypeptidase family protein [Mobilitalea sp.]